MEGRNTHTHTHININRGMYIYSCTSAVIVITIHITQYWNMSGWFLPTPSIPSSLHPFILAATVAVWNTHLQLANNHPNQQLWGGYSSLLVGDKYQLASIRSIETSAIVRFSSFWWYLNTPRVWQWQLQHVAHQIRGGQRDDWESSLIGHIIMSNQWQKLWHWNRCTLRFQHCLLDISQKEWRLFVYLNKAFLRTSNIAFILSHFLFASICLWRTNAL